MTNPSIIKGRKGGAQARRGVTLVETTIALAVLAVLGAIVAQCVVWSVRERARLAAHQAALELCANVLEAARAQPWERLDKKWADGQGIPSETADLLPEGKLVVTLEPGQPLPQSRRVTVEVRWQSLANAPPQTATLTGIFSAREAKKSGGEP
jgi:prepilin-type N-terminal cleavage/methylation domain-containing protein